MTDQAIKQLDALGAADGYVTPPTESDIAYAAYFRSVCKRYNIDFASADQDERDFVIRMTEKGFFPKRA